LVHATKGRQIVHFSVKERKPALGDGGGRGDAVESTEKGNSQERGGNVPLPEDAVVGLIAWKVGRKVVRWGGGDREKRKS